MIYIYIIYLHIDTYYMIPHASYELIVLNTHTHANIGKMMCVCVGAFARALYYCWAVHDRYNKGINNTKQYQYNIYHIYLIGLVQYTHSTQQH